MKYQVVFEIRKTGAIGKFCASEPVEVSVPDGNGSARVAISLAGDKLREQGYETRFPVSVSKPVA